jgi:hemoglobin-like flavoprotein
MENNTANRMKTEKEITDTLYKHYLEAYNKVQPGQPYPQWDIKARWLYEGIEEITSDLSTQLAKANSDKERLGELLKEAIVEYSVQQRHAGYEIIKKQYSQAQQRILQTLQDCGITL